MASLSADESGEAQAHPTHDEQIYAMVELAQICHFCGTFQAPLKLPSFSRTDLQAALIAGTSGDDRQVALVAEVHFKLVREQGAKLERMIQEWERAVTRKVTDNWRFEFSSNPFDGVTYDDLTIAQRIQVLNALCHWKLESCAEIQKFLSAVQKETDPKALEALRATPIGYDDAGSTYWYFGDCCWIYAEDRPEWQSQGRHEYAVEFADAKRIRLSVNFDPQQRVVPLLDAVAPEKVVEPSIENGEPTKTADKMQITTLVEQIDEDEEMDEPVPVKKTEEIGDMPDTKEKLPQPQEVKSHSGKMDITMLCGSSPTAANSPKPEPMDEDERDVSEDKFMSTIVSKHDPITTEPKTVDEKIDVKDSQANAVHTENGETTDDSAPEKKRRFSDEQTTDDSVSEKKRRLSDEQEDNKIDIKIDEAVHIAPPKKRRTRFHDIIRVSDETSQPLEEKFNTALKVETHEMPSTKTELPTVPSVDSSAATANTDQDEDFDINCEACHRSYDRRYLDPPLEKRPVGEWRCFECLVNDARGWPRRRNPTSKSPKGSTTDAPEESDATTPRKKTSSSSSRSRNKSSSSKSSKKKSSSRSSSSTPKKGSSSKKSSKKHKKSSSSKHHGSSSRHHHNRHREEYAKLLKLAHGRKRERLAIEDERLNGVHLCPVSLDGPTGWRVVCCSVEGLRQVIDKLVGGSLEQDRLRGRLISILKVEEKMEAERLKKREQQLWQVLPRRQSSRVAMGRIKSQHSGDSASDSEEDKDGGRRLRHSQRSSRLRSNGHDSRDRPTRDRESRARRRRGGDGSESDSESEQDAGLSTRSVEGWINWTSVKGDSSLGLVCSGLINRLLKEEISDLFSRPVDPEQDGCPDYLTVIQQPMDLGTIQKRVDSGYYTAWEPFKMDVDRVWKNCRQYNPPDTVVVEYADALDEMFKKMRKEAERKGVRKMGKSDSEVDDKTAESENDDVDDSSADESLKGKTKSDSSASEASSDESDDSSDATSEDDDDEEPESKRKTRNRSSSSTPRQSRSSTRPNRPSRSSAAKARPSRRKTKNSDSEEEAGSTSGSDKDAPESDSDGSERRSRSRLRRGSQGSKQPEARESRRAAAPKEADDAKPTPASNRRMNRIDESSDSSSSEASDKADDSSSSSDSDDGEAKPPKHSTKPSAPASVEAEQSVPTAAPPPPSPPPPPPPPSSTTTTPVSSSRKPKPPAPSNRSRASSAAGYQSPASSSSYFSSSDSESSASGTDSSDSD